VSKHYSVEMKGKQLFLIKTSSQLSFSKSSYSKIKTETSLRIVIE